MPTIRYCFVFSKRHLVLTMIKRAFCILLTFTFMPILCFAVNAENTVEYQYNNVEYTVQIQALFPNKHARIFSIICAKLAKEDQQNLSASIMLENPDKIAAYDHIATNSEGGFSYGFEIDSVKENGTYTVLITDGKTSSSFSFFHFSQEAAERVLRELNSQSELSDFSEYFFSFLRNDNFPVAIEDIEELSEESQQEMVRFLFKNKTNDFNTFARNFKTKLALISIENALRADISALIQQYAALLEVNASYVPKLTALQHTYFLDIMQAASYEDAEVFFMKYQEALVLSWASYPQNYIDIRTALSTFDEITVDFNGDYKALKDTNEVFRAMTGKKYSSVSELQNSFYKEVSNQKEKESNNRRGLSSNGSSASIIGTMAIEQQPTVTVNPSEFNDLNSTAWAKEAISALQKKGVLQGDGTGMFYPERPVTRAEFVKMIVCAFELKISRAKTNFQDVQEDSWEYLYVASAFSLGLVEGISKTEFGGNDFITREDMAVIINRTAHKLGLKLTGEPVVFKDEDAINDYAVDAIRLMSAAGIIKGIEKYFCPKEIATRAQSAVIIYRLLERMI